MSALKQFSLLSLLFATLVVAVFCWAVANLPPPLWTFLGWLLIASAILSTIVYGRDNVRAFAVGCAVPAVAWGFVILRASSSEGMNGDFLFAILLSTVLSGGTSVGIRRWALRQAELQAPRTSAAEAEGDPFGQPAAEKESMDGQGTKAPSSDEEVFHFIEDHRRYWACNVCHDVFISLQPQPACPICGSTSVAERPPIARARRSPRGTVRS